MMKTIYLLWIGLGLAYAQPSLLGIIPGSGNPCDIHVPQADPTSAIEIARSWGDLSVIDKNFDKIYGQWAGTFSLLKKANQLFGKIASGV